MANFRKIDQQLLVICGPTATGKTSLALKLAQKFNGEIVSADSRQVYWGMNIATGKDHPRKTKINLIDVARPNEEFSIAHYCRLAGKIIKDIWQKEKSPILVGGTGFYIKGLIDGIETMDVLPDWELRRKLEKFPTRKLFLMLARLDSGKAALLNVSDRKNPRRLIRAIEIAGKIQSAKCKIQNDNSKLKVDKILFIGLKASYEELYSRIDKRIDKQVKMGAEEEIKKLLEQGYGWDLPAMTAMGYGVWQPYFEKKASKEEIIKKWKFAEHAYARRQMTWFKKDKQVNWFDITKNNWQNKAENLVGKWYNEADAKKN